MPSFSTDSKKKLEQCHPLLQALFEKVIERYDCKVLEGYRSPSRQDLLYSQGQSKAEGGQSAHNYEPSLGVDVTPYPIPKNWGERDENEKDKFYHFAFYVLGVAHAMGIQLRWGGDWDSDKDVNDQAFNDLVHFELANWKEIYRAR